MLLFFLDSVPHMHAACHMQCMLVEWLLLLGVVEAGTYNANASQWHWFCGTAHCQIANRLLESAAVNRQHKIGWCFEWAIATRLRSPRRQAMA